MELANGYHELTDPKEQKKRFDTILQQKKDDLPIDTKFLQALEKGIGDATYGVAVGFDRLMMLMLKKSHIKDVLPFYWEEI